MIIKRKKKRKSVRLSEERKTVEKDETKSEKKERKGENFERKE